MFSNHAAPKTFAVAVTTKPADVCDAEDRLSAYYDEHYGPQWGVEHTREAHALSVELFDLYERHDVAVDERVAGFESRPVLPEWCFLT
jgi:hypothetical protein